MPQLINNNKNDNKNLKYLKLCYIFTADVSFVT